MVSVMFYPRIFYRFFLCELFVYTIRNIFGCGSYFVNECYGSIECGLKRSVG